MRKKEQTTMLGNRRIEGRRPENEVATSRPGILVVCSNSKAKLRIDGPSLSLRITLATLVISAIAPRDS